MELLSDARDMVHANCPSSKGVNRFLVIFFHTLADF